MDTTVGDTVLAVRQTVLSNSLIFDQNGPSTTCVDIDQVTGTSLTVSNDIAGGGTLQVEEALTVSDRSSFSVFSGLANFTDVEDGTCGI